MEGKYRDNEYYQGYDTGTPAVDANGNNIELGDFQWAYFPDMTNNFMIEHVGPNKKLKSVELFEVELQIKRAIQELSYDVARPISSLEYQLSNGKLTIPFPQDLVSVTNVSFLDMGGLWRRCREQRKSGNPKAPIQDTNTGAYVYDTNTGDVVYDANSSESRKRYEEEGLAEDVNSSYYPYDTTNRNSPYSGGLYGIDPEQFTGNGTYIVDEDKGFIVVDGSLVDRFIIVEYVSDGISNTDPSKIKIHKFMEEAVYAYAYWRIMRSMDNVNQYDKEDARKEFFVSKRRAKKRLSKITANDLVAVLHGSHKWINH